MKAKDLKDLVKAKGLPVTGTNPQLLARLYTGKKHNKEEEEKISMDVGGTQQLTSILLILAGRTRRSN